jgi:uncharacterized oxidoreductase
MVNMPVYCATKAAVHTYTMVLRRQLKDTSVRVVEIVPPMVDTGLIFHGEGAGVMSESREKIENRLLNPSW